MAARRVRSGFSSTTVTPPPGTYRLFPSADGPSSPVSYSGPFMRRRYSRSPRAAAGSTATGGGCARPGSPRRRRSSRYGHVQRRQRGTLVAGSTVTSGALTAGQWNYVPLAAPCRWHRRHVHRCTGFSGSFPDTNNQFGSGEPYSAGIVNGPLTAFSDTSGSAVAVHHGPGRIQRRRHRSRRPHADLRFQFRQLLDGRPGRHQPAGGHVLPAVAGLPDAPGHR